MEILCLWIHFPVWRELKLLFRVRNWQLSAPSEYTFPFEGNGNILTTNLQFSEPSSEYTFPFEGNGNLSLDLRHHNFSATLNTLSRLKGIETYVSDLSVIRFNILWIHFPVWRELKHSAWFNMFEDAQLLWIHFPVWREWKRLLCRLSWTRLTPLNTLSRLKGIETMAAVFNILIFFSLWTHFPVWRELKPVGNASSKTILPSSEYTFPFEGNWNRSAQWAMDSHAKSSEYTFPFEGNWNESDVLQYVEFRH